ncbi:ABC transporter permease [Arthrobacter sp. TB 23]|uniref:ABC transporter permease n=1 Tax=Arthrobacter sp. TB 23 TaxID=494419 RepID=UPI00037CFFF7|nr:ABC transporter permease [Arthrobacter sp. TB 23]
MAVQVTIRHPVQKLTEKKQRGGTIRSLALFIAPLAACAALAELLVRIGVLDERLTPAPSTVFARMIELAGPTGNYLLWVNLGTSASRVLPALLIAAVLGIAIGIALGLSRKASDYLSPLLGFMLPLPAVAWTPVFVVSIGRGYDTMLIVLVLGAVFPILYNVMSGVQGITDRQIWAMRSLGGSKLDVLFRVILPAAWPAILNGLRLGMGHAWRTLVAVELLTSATLGLGALIFNSRSSLDTPTMYVSILVIAVAGLLIDHTFFRYWESRTIGKWGESQ